MDVKKSEALKSSLGAQFAPHLMAVGVGVPYDDYDAPEGYLVLLFESAPANLEAALPREYDGLPVYAERLPCVSAVG